MSGYAECRERGCGRDILFARTIPGQKLMPIDPGVAPDDEEYANLAVRKDHLGSLYVRVLAKGEVPMVTERRGVPHFATCPARQKKKPTDPTPALRVVVPDSVPPQQSGVVLPFRGRR